MSNGAFLKENKKTDKATPAPKLSDEERKARTARRKRRKAQKRMISVIAIVGALVAAVALVAVFLGGKNPLVGKWNVDSVTAYRFDENGTGALILPSSEYAFRYTVKDDILFIDFENENVKDSEYIFERSDDVLILNGGNNTTKGELVLEIESNKQ